MIFFLKLFFCFDELIELSVIYGKNCRWWNRFSIFWLDFNCRKGSLNSAPRAARRWGRSKKINKKQKTYVRVYYWFLFAIKKKGAEFDENYIVPNAGIMFIIFLNLILRYNRYNSTSDYNFVYMLPPILMDKYRVLFCGYNFLLRDMC